MKNICDALFLHIGKDAEKELKKLNISVDKIFEIRIIVNRPLMAVTANGILAASHKTFSSADIKEIFASFCQYSVHAYQNEIREGFITAEYGIRVGICGTAIYENDKIFGVKEISGLNIRIPREIIGCAEKLYDLEGGILIIGPPCCGKTTLLRDFARNKSKNYKVTVIDERMEIAGMHKGAPSFDAGDSFVLNGFLKNDGIKIAARSLSPDYIICDEFGDENDISSALFAMKSGTTMVASMHVLNKEDFLSKPFVDKLIKSGIFKNFIFLNKNFDISYCSAKELST